MDRILLVDDDTMLHDIVRGQPTYYLLKANITPGELLEKVKQVLKERKSL